MPKSTTKTEFFIRELYIETNNKIFSEPLRLHQKTIGDVNCIVWDAAIVLSKYLEKLHHNNKNYLVGANVLELGAGVGCVGLVAACLGANVTLTDLPEAFSTLEHNIEENHHLISINNGRAHARILKWGEEIDIDTPDKIFLADCIYYRESIDALITTLYNLSTAKTEILQVQEMRDSDKQRKIWECYVHKLQKAFNMEEIPQWKQNEEFSSSDIKLYRISKK